MLVKNMRQIKEHTNFIEDTFQAVAVVSYVEVKTIVLGDFNATHDAIYKNAKLFAVKTLFDDLKLRSCNLLDISDVGYTNRHKSLEHKSCIDHYFDSSNLLSHWK